MRKIKVLTPYEDIEIGGEVFRIDLSDAGLKRMAAEFDPLMQEAADTQSDMKLTDTERLDKHIQTMNKAAVLLFGEGSAERLHKACGGSIYAMMDVIVKAAQFFEGKMKRK